MQISDWQDPGYQKILIVCQVSVTVSHVAQATL